MFGVACRTVGKNDDDAANQSPAHIAPSVPLTKCIKKNKDGILDVIVENESD